jgi:hypothetical protein
MNLEARAQYCTSAYVQPEGMWCYQCMRIGYHIVEAEKIRQCRRDWGMCACGGGVTKALREEIGWGLVLCIWLDLDLVKTPLVQVSMYVASLVSPR